MIKDRLKKDKEASFTLLETIIAVGLLAMVMVGSTQIVGTAVIIEDYNRNMSEAGWIAHGLMAQLEWAQDHYPIKELSTLGKGREEDVPIDLCPVATDLNRCPYTFRLDILEWKLPLADLMAKKMGDIPQIKDMIKTQLTKILGQEELLYVAKLEVLWPEGSYQNSTSFAYLMVNQSPIDRFLQTMSISPKPTLSPPAGDKTVPQNTSRPPPTNDGGFE